MHIYNKITNYNDSDFIITIDEFNFHDVYKYYLLL